MLRLASLVLPMALPHRAACMGGLLALTLQLQAPSPLLVLIDRAQRRQALPLMRTDLVTSTTIRSSAVLQAGRQ
ncbi:hypothetical protein SynRCC2555_01034 [Synechococcus sp. WH 8101]|nr:hypothetical protein SynRCC2555_01034 [Synechococcus sp. WH 8101]